MLSIFSCACWPSTWLLQRNYLALLIFWLFFFLILQVYNSYTIWIIKNEILRFSKFLGSNKANILWRLKRLLLFPKVPDWCNKINKLKINMTLRVEQNCIWVSASGLPLHYLDMRWWTSDSTSLPLSFSFVKIRMITCLWGISDF